MKLPSKQISFSDLDKNPKLLALFEANWNLINSLSSDDFIAWSEQADPIQLQNFHIYGEYKKRISKRSIVLQNILNHEITKSILDFLLKVGTVAAYALIFTGSCALLVTLVIFVIWVGVKIYLYNKIFSGVYFVFMFVFITLLPRAFFNY